MYVVARVAVENAAAGFDKEYSYLVPEALKATALAGCRCTVPFGGGNKKRTGVILALEEIPEIEKLKPLYAVLDSPPLLDGEGLFLLRYIHETTFCTWFDALRLLIPSGLGVTRQAVYSAGKTELLNPLMQGAREVADYITSRRSPVEESALCARFGLEPDAPVLTSLVECGAVVKSERLRQRVADEKQTMVRLVQDANIVPLTPKQKKACFFLEENETASLKEVCYYTGVTRIVVDGLVKKGIAEYFDFVTLRNPCDYAGQEISEPPPLSDMQLAVYEGLRSLCDSGEGTPALLYGVTGSGKTEVFLKLVEHTVAAGKSAIVLVPEISLTPQALESFRKRFGGRVAMLHSGLSLGERMDEWRRIRSGGADVVVGTRSAVFAPLGNLGLIVIDEEQEHAYKSDKSPRYHARDMAMARAGYNKAMLLLSSATPSIESFYLANEGKYRLFTLETRFNQGGLPDVEIVDMRDAANVSAHPSLSSILLEELHDNLARGEQSILLLNRRGHSPLVKCSSCGAVAECKNCSVALTYHAANDSLVCHYCGYTSRSNYTRSRDYTNPRESSAGCQSCGSKLVRYAGTGTQKLEEELKALFPDARIIRVDMDATMSKFAHEKLFSAFASGDYDIMVGTQMVAKGLNFPNVTLVGVLQADQSLYSGDFRGFERTFSLMTQVVGRSGRGGKRGRACVQTYSPENLVIMLAAEQDYPAFYKQEIGIRKLHLYPPFCALYGVGFSGINHDETRKAAEKFAEEFKRVAKESYPNLPIRLLGPSPAEVLRTAGKYRYKLVIKCRDSRRQRDMLRRLLEWFAKETKNVGIYIDAHAD